MMSKRRFDVTMTLFLRHVSAGKIGVEIQHFPHCCSNIGVETS